VCFIHFVDLLTLVHFWFAGVNTMKLNKSRLKQMAQSGEVAVAPISLKRKKPDEGSSRRSEEALARPSVPIVTPPVVPAAAPSVQKAPTVIMVDSDLTPPSAGSTINQSPLVAMDRAKAAITPQDADEYAVAHTDDLSLLMVHSLMRVRFSVFLLLCVFFLSVFVINLSMLTGVD
jgi:hypothetical protein